MPHMKLVSKALAGVRALRRYVDRPWFPFALAGLTFIDFFVVFIPSDGIIVASSMARPKKWFSMAVWMSVGSLLGGVLLAIVTRHYGEPFIAWLSPNLLSSHAWKLSEAWIEKHGVGAMFLIAASPLAQQPSMLLAGLANVSMSEIALALGTGRLIKFLVYSWIASHTPKLIKKIPAIGGELEDLEVDPRVKDDTKKS